MLSHTCGVLITQASPVRFMGEGTMQNFDTTQCYTQNDATCTYMKRHFVISLRCNHICIQPYFTIVWLVFHTFIYQWSLSI